MHTNSSAWKGTLLHHYGLTTRPDLIQLVQTLILFVWPFWRLLTLWRLGYHRFLVLLWAWLILYPTTGFLPQISQTFAISGSPLKPCPPSQTGERAGCKIWILYDTWEITKWQEIFNIFKYIYFVFCASYFRLILFKKTILGSSFFTRPSRESLYIKWCWMLDPGCWLKKAWFPIDIQYPETSIQYLGPMKLRLLFMAMKR